jgi:hypothetical protein
LLSYIYRRHTLLADRQSVLIERHYARSIIFETPSTQCDLFNDGAVFYSDHRALVALLSLLLLLLLLLRANGWRHSQRRSNPYNSPASNGVVGKQRPHTAPWFNLPPLTVLYQRQRCSCCDTAVGGPAE